MSNKSQTMELSDEHKNALSNIQDFVNQMQNANILQCDENCQKNYMTQLYYDNYALKKANLENASKLFENAEKNYIITDKGVNYYNDIKEKEYTQDAKLLVKKMNDKFKGISELIEEKINNNIILNKSLSHISELNNDYVEKIANLETEIDTNENSGNIANRITYYENKSINFWCSTNYIIKILFWLLFISYLIIAIIYKQYTKRHVQIALFLFPLFGYFKGHTIYRHIMSYI